MKKAQHTYANAVKTTAIKQAHHYQDKHTMNNNSIDKKELEQQLNLETAKIRWHELQRFFASGNAIAVSVNLDLTQVAAEIVADNAMQIKRWMDAGQVDVVKDTQAKVWYDDDAVMWAVVIKPWVLVQPLNA